MKKRDRVKQMRTLENEYRINENPGTGICQVIENGELCNQSVICRKICKRHYDAFMIYGLLKKYASPSRQASRTEYLILLLTSFQDL